MNSFLSFTIAHDPDEEIIVLQEDFGSITNQCIYHYIRLKDKAVRDKLIEMGWTPPNEA